MTTFVSALSDVLRKNGILSGNDTDITTFADTQHQANIQKAKYAIQTTLNQLVSERLIPYERTDGLITFVDGTRVYALPSDFIRFADDVPFMLRLDSSDNSDNLYVYEYPGGVDRLSSTIPDYREQPGTPWSFYLTGGTTEQVGFYQVPDSTVDTLKVRFSYEAEVMVNVAADVIPFTRTSQDIAFIDLASRYFFLSESGVPIEKFEQDPVYVMNKTTLINLMRHKKPSKRYGYRYR